MIASARTAAFVVFGLLLFVPAAPGQKDKDKSSRREQDHEYVVGQSRTAMLMLAQAEQWRSADAAEQGLLLRALVTSGIPHDDERIRTVFQQWLALDISGDLLARSERIWILALMRDEDTGAELRRLVAEVSATQQADGGFNARPRGKAAPDRVLVTGRVLEELAAAERLAVPAPAKVWPAASGFLLASQGSDGSFLSGERRATGATTARGLAGLLAAAARIPAGERRGVLLQAAARAEKWLVQAFRPDRNPGAQRGTYEWLGAVETAMARAWLARAEEHVIAEEVFRYLQGAQLTATGWNEDHAEALPLRPGPGGSGGGRPAGGGTPLVQRTQADIGDTAWAALFLAGATRPTPAEQAIAAGHRLAALARTGARAEDGTDFVERVRAAMNVLPVLLEGLMAEGMLVRRAANDALRALSEKDMGYVPQATAAANAPAISRWREWARNK